MATHLFSFVQLTGLFCCTVDVVFLCRLPPTTVNDWSSCCCCCFWTFCVGFLLFADAGSVCLFDVWAFVCCFVDSSSSLRADFGWVTGGARVAAEVFVWLSLADGGGVVERVLFLLRLRALDDVSAVWTGAFNNS